MGFKPQRVPGRLIFHSVLDDAIDNKVVIEKHGSIESWMNAVKADPTNRDLFPVKQGERLADFAFVPPTVDALADVRDSALGAVKGGKNYTVRFNAAYNLFLFRACLVRASNIFPNDPDFPNNFSNEPPAEGETLGTLEQLFTLLPPAAQSNIGMLLNAAIEDATAAQGK